MKFKAGDKIVCNRARNINLTVGKTYTVIEYSQGHPKFLRLINDIGRKNGYSDKWFDLAKTEKAPFKVGDQITCINDYNRDYHLAKGYRYTVEGIMQDPLRFKVKNVENYHLASRFVLDRKVNKEEKMSKINKGDIVTCKNSYKYAYIEGRTGYKVLEVRTSNIVNDKILLRNEEGSEFWYESSDFVVTELGEFSQKDSTIDQLINEANLGLKALRELGNNKIYKEKIELYDKGYNSSYFLSNCKTLNLKYDKAVRKVEEKKVTKTTIHLASGDKHTIQANITDMRIGCKEFKTAEIRKALPKLLDGSWGSAKVTQLNAVSCRQLTATRRGLKYHGDMITWKDAELINNILIDAFGEYND